jgi:hypothetical protein
MEDTTIVEKSNTKREWHFPRAVEVFYPSKIGSTQDRHNWITAMILDSRLGDRDKVVLARLALHLNLKRAASIRRSTCWRWRHHSVRTKPPAAEWRAAASRGPKN